ncbi:MAG TPA: pyridoxal-phosphate dependent enzyme [Gemmatimonadaceae bacterium]|nr:pyridoxal-phosphate dependent enzyme [Gemmatimonadaceae bacterium]
MTNPFETAADSLRRYFRPTPLVPSPALSGHTTSVWLKVETGLPTGSFKVRGAVWSLARELERGPVAEVVAASTGNHGAAVAWAAQQLGVRARIFVPERANPTKLDKIRGFGAHLEESGRDLTEAIRAAERYAEDSGAFLLADAMVADVPVGAGTMGVEIAKQLPNVDIIYVGVGDTALVRGVAGAVKLVLPHVRVVGVAASGAPAYYRSWKSGRVETTASADTFADGLAVSHPLQPNVDAIRRLVDDFELVTDDEMLAAIAFLLREEERVIEPAAAAPVAAFMRARPSAGNVVLVISGANIAPDVLARARQVADKPVHGP